MAFFSSLSFWPLELCVKLHLAKENRRGQEGGMAMPELGHMYNSTPQHPRNVTESGCHLNSLDTLQHISIKLNSQ